MLDTTPQPHTVGFPCDSTPPPACLLFHSDAKVPALFRLRVSPSVPQELYTIHRRFPRAGTFGASQVLRRLSSCMPRPEDSGGPAPPRQSGWARVAFGCVQTLGVRNRHVEAVPALQGTRLPLRPTGYSVYASSILFARVETPTPPWTQDSIRVGGSPLPDRDFHPARDAKLILARERQVSGAAGSRSDAGAEQLSWLSRGLVYFFSPEPPERARASDAFAWR